MDGKAVQSDTLDEKVESEVVLWVESTELPQKVWKAIFNTAAYGDIRGIYGKKVCLQSESAV